jgi:hypothetical protein
MGWVIPPRAAWHTCEEHEEELIAAAPRRSRLDVWDSLKVNEGELSIEDLDLLEVLASGGDDELLGDEEEDAVVRHLTYWTAELRCDGRGAVAVTYDRLFETRDELVAAIRWFTLHASEIRHEEGSTPPWPVDHTAAAVSTDVAEWRSYSEAILSFWAGETPVLGTLAYAVKQKELDDFAVWLLDAAASFDIDPARSTDGRSRTASARSS